jgi:hypothetical protein
MCDNHNFLTTFGGSLLLQISNSTCAAGYGIHEKVHLIATCKLYFIKN